MTAVLFVKITWEIYLKLQGCVIVGRLAGAYIERGLWRQFGRVNHEYNDGGGVKELRYSNTYRSKNAPR
jgi:hypothetical protein